MICESFINGCFKKGFLNVGQFVDKVDKVDKVDFTCGGRTRKPHLANDQPGNRTQTVHCNQTHTGEKPNHMYVYRLYRL